MNEQRTELSESIQDPPNLVAWGKIGLYAKGSECLYIVFIYAHHSWIDLYLDVFTFIRQQ